MIVIACNTATAAGLQMAQSEFRVPVLGVIEPGARAAVRVTENKKVGVIATKGTVNSGAYSNAIRAINPEITVFSTPTPRFVEIAEAGVKMAKGPIEDYTSLASKVYIRPEFEEIAREYLEPLRRCNIDTLVMGCTHFPLLKSLIGSVVGRNVQLINSACEIAQDVKRALASYNLEACAQKGAQKGVQKGARSQKTTSINKPTYEFFTTGNDLHEFKKFGERVFRTPITNVAHADI